MTAAVVAGAIISIPIVVQLCGKIGKRMTLFYYLAAYGCVLLIANFIPPAAWIVYMLGMCIGFVRDSNPPGPHLLPHLNNLFDSAAKLAVVH